MRFSRRVGALTVTLAAALALSGCGILPFFPGGGGGGGAERPGPTGEQVAAELAPFYTQELEWRGCGGRIDCTEVTVPLDWSAPTGATIEIAIARHKASGTPLGSLLVNPGGPGGSGFDFVQRSASAIVSPRVLAEYDIIGFDPRGVGNSTPIECYTTTDEQDHYLYGTYASPYGTQGWLDELTTREQRWAATCERNTGALLGHLDAASVARDMDVIRAVLGDSELHYLGYSYGTYLGTVYAELFPEKVGRMVLDGAVDPLVGDLEALTIQMAGFDSALRAYMEWCLERGAECPFRGSTDAALASVRQMLDTVDARGFVASDGRELDSATVATGIVFTLYSEGSWPALSELFTQLRRGDADTVFLYADAYNGRTPYGYDDNSMDIYTAVTCNEGNLATDGVDVFEGLERIDAAAPILGRYAAYDDYAVLKVVCSNWPVPVAQLPETFTAEGAAPIMVIGTTNDPATPYANAVSLAKQLSSGFLVSYEGEGHTIYAHGVACIDDTVDAYLISGTVPDADPRC